MNWILVAANIPFYVAIQRRKSCLVCISNLLVAVAGIRIGGRFGYFLALFTCSLMWIIFFFRVVRPARQSGDGSQVHTK